MKIVNKISFYTGKYMAIITLVIAALALFVPDSFLWVQTSWVNNLLMIVMFGMGLTLKPSDFKLVFLRPKELLVGCLAQFTIMPLIAFGLGKVFGLEAGFLAGVILTGTCPGGTSSNVITYLSKGDVALSVSMTAVNTLLAPVLTPAITYFMLRTTISIDIYSMFISIVEVVIVPIVLGLIINRLFSKQTEKVTGGLTFVSVLAIGLIVGAVVSHNSQSIMRAGAMIFAVVILLNILGYAAGYLLGRLLKFPMPKKKALAIEIGMQNSGLAASLAASVFPNMAAATVPGAIFSVWHNVSGAILAAVFRRID